jgi:hypothetical protein
VEGGRDNDADFTDQNGDFRMTFAEFAAKRTGDVFT